MKSVYVEQIEGFNLGQPIIIKKLHMFLQLDSLENSTLH